MNNLDKQYTNLLQDIIDNGVTKGDRTGTGTLSVFGRQIRHKMSDGFPLLTTKKMAWKTMVTELLWFLRGDTNIKFLVDNGCHIWDGDAYKSYLKHNDEVDNYWIKKNPEIKSRWKPYSKEEFINKIKTDDEFARQWGELGPIYGRMWRMFDEDTYEGIDQIANLINDLKTNPDSRRLLVTAWHPGYNQHSVLPPCHYGFQVYTRELIIEERVRWAYDRKLIDYVTMVESNELDKLNVPKRAISLMWNQRSVDTFLGLPFNIASYGLLLEIIAKAVNMVPDELIGNLGDVHLYSNHVEQAKEQIGREMNHDEKVKYARSLYGDKDWWNINDDRVLEILHSNKRTREPYPLPKLVISNQVNFNEGIDEFLNSCLIFDFQIEGYQSHPSIKAPLSN